MVKVRNTRPNKKVCLCVERHINNGIFLLLGSNKGDRLSNLLVAREQLGITCGPIIKSSSLYETEAWGMKDQPGFYNQIVKIETTLSPHELLDAALSIEKNMGRIREMKWGPRIIDIDILLYDDIVVQSENLVIPHPGIAERRFTLIPLAELAEDLVHPVLEKTIAKLLKDCSDTSTVKLVEL